MLNEEEDEGYKEKEKEVKYKDEKEEVAKRQEEEEEASAVQIFLLLWIASNAVHLSEPVVTRWPLPWLALVSSHNVNKISSGYLSH